MSATAFFFLALCASLAIPSEGNGFLKAPSKHVVGRMSEQDVQTSLLAEIEGSLGTGIASKRVTDMKAILEPMFLSLPKNAHGNLEHVTVRFALHRVFVQRHGWVIKGLDPAGAAGNASSSAGILKDQAPSYIQNLFEQRLDGRGLGLHELAVLAATLEHLVHDEAIGRLGAALGVHGVPPTALLSEADADAVLDTYMMAYILGEDLGNMTLEDAQGLIEEMPEIFLAWNATQEFVRGVRKDMTQAKATADGSSLIEGSGLSFATLVSVAETVGERFGRFQDAECKGLKDALVKIEDRGSGRVRLSDFYRPALDGSWQFQENIGYLRQLGALDESNSDEPRVMIANYLISQTNCIASSDYYSVCCINECEDLLGHLEREIAGPEAQPSRVIELVSALPSSSVSAPRELSATLRTRLEDIAAEHGGFVQLHGRLFSQWMHHAYPRECPYPHLSGTTSQQKPEEWTDGNGEDATASEEELLQFTAVNRTDAAQLDTVEDMHDLMMWSQEEELLIVRAPVVPSASVGFLSSAASVQSVVLFAALMSIVAGLLRTTTAHAGARAAPEKFLV